MISPYVGKSYVTNDFTLENIFSNPYTNQTLPISKPNPNFNAAGELIPYTMLK